MARLRSGQNCSTRSGAHTSSSAAYWTGWTSGTKRIDFIDFSMMMDKAQEEGETVFPALQVGNAVMLENSQRWYIGRVAARDSVTITLEEPAAVSLIDDLTQFLSGVLCSDTEVSPYPHGFTLDVNMGDIQTAVALPDEVFTKVRVRTHGRRPERGELPPQEDPSN